MPEFYHQLITEESFKLLKELKRKYDFILIGGWAVFLYTKTLKSKDIDLVIDYSELGKLRMNFEVFKNERLKKYEIKIKGVDVDIYLPFFSALGFPVEKIQNYVQSLEGFVVPYPEILLILKTATYQERKGTTKGTKDLIDIFSLLKKAEINWQTYQKIIKKYKLQGLNQELKKLITSTGPISELNLNEYQIARLKKQVLKELGK